MLPLPVPVSFERETGCTESDWLRWLPAACKDQPLMLPTPGHAQVSIAAGHLALQWSVMPPRRIALVSMPRMRVSYVFHDVSEGERAEFMRYFDLVMQRGGG